MEPGDWGGVLCSVQKSHVPQRFFNLLMPRILTTFAIPEKLEPVKNDNNELSPHLTLPQYLASPHLPYLILSNLINKYFN